MQSPHLNNPHQERLDPPNKLPHFVLPTAEHSVTEYGHAHGCIHSIYTHGISLMDEPSAVHGLLAMNGFLGGVMAATMIYGFTRNQFADYHTQGLDWSLLIGTLIMILGFFICIIMIRMESIGHRYQPVLFDRARSKMHLFISEPPALWQIWRWRSSFRVESYDWSCVRAEVVEIRQVGGSAAPRNDYALMCAVVDAPRSPKVRLRIGLGFAYAWAPQPALQLWEHIRLFMQKQGKHLALGDSIYLEQNSVSFWSSLWIFQPLLGPGSKQHWTGESFMGFWFLTIPFGVLILALLPFTMVGGIVRWLTYQCKQTPVWPAEILASVGDKIDTTVPKVTWTQRRKALKNKK